MKFIFMPGAKLFLRLPNEKKLPLMSALFLLPLAVLYLDVGQHASSAIKLWVLGGVEIGLEVNVDPFEVEPAVALFSERPAIVYEVGFDRLPRLSQAAREHGLVAWPIGTVTPQPLVRALLPGSEQVRWTVQELREAAGHGLRRRWNEEGV